MRIMYVITGLGVGGAERQVTDLAKGFTARGSQVIICYLVGNVAVKIPDGVEVYGLNMGKGPLDIFRAIRKLVGLIKEFRPDVLHSHMFHANILSRLAKIYTKLPVLVCTAHSNNEGGRGRMLAYRMTDFLANVSTNVSNEAVRSFVQKKAAPQSKLIAVVNGIDTDLFRPNPILKNSLRKQLGVPDGACVILSVGRLDVAKDYPNLIKSFSELLSRNYNVFLVIVGEGNQRFLIEELIAQLNISHAVMLLGMRNDVAQLYNLADVYVLSSAWEGFGLVVAEAMATENVIVATDCGGVGQVVGQFGYLVPPKDPIALCGSIEQALNLSTNEKVTLGKNARTHVLENYSISAVLDIWESMYISETQKNKSKHGKQV